jgi:hypothetical protein
VRSHVKNVLLVTCMPQCVGSATQRQRDSLTDFQGENESEGTRVRCECVAMRGWGKAHTDAGCFFSEAASVKNLKNSPPSYIAYGAYGAYLAHTNG